MPYHIGEKGSYGCDGFPVVKDSDETVMGCHATEDDAKKQLAALYINEPEASKEKSMAKDYAHGYASIVKYDKNDDGTLMVFGKATDDSLDLDSQICDPAWLDTAMPAWFKSGGNIREMHGPSAAGVAKEYEAKSDGHYIGVHVVDPIAVKKVEARVYQGFSIGIKSPRVVRDAKAANGRIIDGQIIEVSLVDRPANPSAKLILAKAIEGESSLVQVEELHEYKAPLPSEIFKHGDHDQSDHSPTGGGGSSERDSADNPRDTSVDRDNSVSEGMSYDMRGIGDSIADLESELINASPGGVETEESESCRNSQESIVQAVNSLEDATNSDNMEDHTESLETALGHLNDAHDYLSDVDHGDAEDLQERIGQAIMDLEDYLGDVSEKFVKSTTTKEPRMARQRKAEKSAINKEEATNSVAPMNGESKAIPSREEMMERYAAARKAVDDVASEAKSYGYDDLDKAYGETAEEETAEGPAVSPETAEEEVQEAREQKPVDEAKAADAEKESDEDKEEKVSEDDESEDDDAIKALVEKAVKSAMESVRAEIDTLRAEKESAVEKSVKLETELTTALSKTVAGGPKRTATTYGAESNEYLVKALTYKAKADATTDPVLRKGYSDLYEEFNAKAFPGQNK